MTAAGRRGGATALSSTATESPAWTRVAGSSSRLPASVTLPRWHSWRARAQLSPSRRPRSTAARVRPSSSDATSKLAFTRGGAGPLLRLDGPVLGVAGDLRDRRPRRLDGFATHKVGRNDLVVALGVVQTHGNGAVEGGED